MNTVGLIPHQTVSAIVENVDLARHDIDLAFKLLQGAKERLAAVLGDSHGSYYGHIFPKDINDYDLPRSAEAVQAHLAKNAWSYVLRQTGITQYMTETRQKELENQLKNGEFPVLTVENVLSTMEGLSGQLGTLLLESIREVFEWLRPSPRSSAGSYKTNKQFRIGYKVIITYALATWEHKVSAGDLHLNYHWAEPRFRSLGNVMSLLDGQGVPQYPQDLVTQLKQSLRTARLGEWHEVPYMRVKPYQNGNLHIQFVRHDLVDKLNQLGSDGTVGQGDAA